MRVQAPPLPLLAVMLVSIALSGCDEPRVAQADVAEVQPPEVSIVTLTPTPRPYVRNLPGRIAPTRISEVRARVPGIILERTFQQGADVKAGDVLYRIDPAPFSVELDAANAALAKSEAVLVQAEQQAARAEKLIKEQTISQAQYETATANYRQAAADVAARKAEVARAKLNLAHAEVRSPISGRVGRALVTEGALVGQGDATHLATVQQLDPIYADFTQSVTELQQLRRDFESGALEQVDRDAAKVKLVLDDGTIYEHAGKLLFSDATVDPSTGQVTLRAEFPNPKRELLPGMYVRVQIEQGIDVDALAVPLQAIRRDDTGGSQVFVVRPDNRTVARPVRTGHLVDDQWIIEDGIKAGDRVVVEGFQKFVAGDLVKTVPWKNQTATASASDDITGSTTATR